MSSPAVCEVTNTPWHQNKKCFQTLNLCSCHVVMLPSLWSAVVFFFCSSVFSTLSSTIITSIYNTRTQNSTHMNDKERSFMHSVTLCLCVSDANSWRHFVFRFSPATTAKPQCVRTFQRLEKLQIQMVQMW